MAMDYLDAVFPSYKIELTLNLLCTAQVSDVYVDTMIYFPSSSNSESSEYAVVFGPMSGAGHCGHITLSSRETASALQAMFVFGSFALV